VDGLASARARRKPADGKPYRIDYHKLAYALSKDAAQLKHVDFYKVGHHGSLNATPKALWNLFVRRGDRTKRRRLTTLVSTRSNSKHGHRATNTEVPRESLIAELRRKSTLRSTQELEASGKLVLTLTFDL
jgi:hypothetical protein